LTDPIAGPHDHHMADPARGSRLRPTPRTGVGDRVLRWLDAILPAPPEAGAEPSRRDTSVIWMLRRRLPIGQGRPRGGGQGGFR
jgi:hypothetical protein